MRTTRISTSFLLLLIGVVSISAYLRGGMDCTGIDCSRKHPSLCSGEPKGKGDCRSDQKYDPKGGYCGCCGMCINQIGKGGRCAPLSIHSECGSGLKCVERRLIEAGVMHSYKWSITILLIVAGAMITEAIVCTKNICSTVKCQQVEKKDCGEDQKFVPKGGFCGCCNSCVTQLREGESCRTLRGVPPTAQCGDGLQCVDNVCVYQDSDSYYSSCEESLDSSSDGN